MGPPAPVHHFLHPLSVARLDNLLVVPQLLPLLVDLLAPQPEQLLLILLALMLHKVHHLLPDAHLPLPQHQVHVSLFLLCYVFYQIRHYFVLLTQQVETAQVLHEFLPLGESLLGLFSFDTFGVE